MPMQSLDDLLARATNTNRLPSNMVQGGGAHPSLISGAGAALAQQMPAPQGVPQAGPQMETRKVPYWATERQKVIETTPEVLGSPDLYGVQDMMNNMSFQRLFEDYEGGGPAAENDAFWDMPSNRQIHMVGDGQAAIWGDIDKELLPGYQAATRNESFVDTLVKKFKKKQFAVTPDAPAAPAPSLPGPGGHQRKPQDIWNWGRPER